MQFEEAIHSDNDDCNEKVQPASTGIAAVTESSTQPFVEDTDTLLLESNLTLNLMAATRGVTEELKNMVSPQAVQRHDQESC